MNLLRYTHESSVCFNLKYTWYDVATKNLSHIFYFSPATWTRLLATRLLSENRTGTQSWCLSPTPVLRAQMPLLTSLLSTLRLSNQGNIVKEFFFFLRNYSRQLFKYTEIRIQNKSGNPRFLMNENSLWVVLQFYFFVLRM